LLLLLLLLVVVEPVAVVVVVVVVVEIILPSDPTAPPFSLSKGEIIVVVVGVVGVGVSRSNVEEVTKYVLLVLLRLPLRVLLLLLTKGGTNAVTSIKAWLVVAAMMKPTIILVNKNLGNDDDDDDDDVNEDDDDNGWRVMIGMGWLFFCLVLPVYLCLDFAFCLFRWLLVVVVVVVVVVVISKVGNLRQAVVGPRVGISLFVPGGFFSFSSFVLCFGSCFSTRATGQQSFWKAKQNIKR
jgi:hypothetical protein